MLKQETFYEVQSWGCVSALLGLPAELIPQMFVPCLTTCFIISAHPGVVNCFLKNSAVVCLPMEIFLRSSYPAPSLRRFPTAC